MARAATPRRRSTRLSRTGTQTSSHKTPRSTARLESLTERDETPEAEEPTSVDDTISTPTAGRNVQRQLQELSGLRTPKTEPRVDHDQMHPETAHQTTAKAPDSGLKLGFADIPSQPRSSLASIHNTPTRPRRQSLANTNISPTFQFRFSHDNNLSEQGQQLMASIREDAARIKAQLRAEQQGREQGDTDGQSGSSNAAQRRIARPTGKAGRFSDVHLAEFKKMDSIANHSSAWRSRVDSSKPPVKNLKRSGSKAELDSPAKPRVGGARTLTKPTSFVVGKVQSTSPFKSLEAKPEVTGTDTERTAKRVKHFEAPETLTTRPSAIPTSVSNSLLSPTKSSTARASPSKIPTASPQKLSGLTRSNSVRSLRAAEPSANLSSDATINSPTKQPVSTPSHGNRFATDQSFVDDGIQNTTFSSRLPTFSGLRSILRSGWKDATVSLPQAGTPKRPNTRTSTADSVKKVDFTPSVKSRYAVKLAAASPSPAKLDRNSTSASEMHALYDPAAYTVQHHLDDDEEKTHSEDIVYPDLDLALDQRPVVQTLSQKAKEHNRRETREFKSIFTTLHPTPQPAQNATPVFDDMPLNTVSSVASPGRVLLSPRKVSRSTVRQVCPAGVVDTVQPFEDSIQTVPHGIPGKKRRHASIADDAHGGTEHEEDQEKENQNVPEASAAPGGWEAATAEEEEGETRATKRVRTSTFDNTESKNDGSVKKAPSASRQAAARHAKERKSKTGNRGVLSLSRLNMLSRPKQRT